jgi:hypothetical protein
LVAGNLTVTDGLGRYHEFNASAGATAQIGDRLLATVGVTAPLRGGNDRFGDYQLGLRLNYLFGNPR